MALAGNEIVAPEEFEGEAVKAFGRGFNSNSDFFDYVKRGDLVWGRVTAYNRDKATSGIIGAFIRFIQAESWGDRSLDGLISDGNIGLGEGESIEEALPMGGRGVFRVQRIDREKGRITLSAPSMKTGAKPVFRKKTYERSFDVNTPIDNTGVDLGEGDHSICLTLPDATNVKTKPACNSLKFSIQEMENENEPVRKFLNVEKEEGIEHYRTKAQMLIEGCFPADYPMTVFIRNLSYTTNEDDRILPTVGLRLARTPGDWMDLEMGLPVNKTFLFSGRCLNGGKSLGVDHISIVASEENAYAYEVKAEIYNHNEINEVQNPFMESLLAKMVSVTRYTDSKLDEWNQYLAWQEKIAKLQIKGIKYIDVNVNREERQLEFTFLFRDKDAFEQQRKILRRPELTAYSNGISNDELEFDYSEPDSKDFRKIRTSEIGRPKFPLKPFSFAESGNNLDISTELQEAILKKFTHPYFAICAFSMDEDDVDALDRKIQQTEGNEDAENIINDFIQSTILSKYRFSENGGFLALSAVGELSLIGRLGRAIRSLKNGDCLNPHLGEWLFDVTKARLPDPNETVEIDHWLDPNIANNENQREAIKKILTTKDLFLLQGPPGTGKTTVIAEAIYQFAIRGMNVLLASQSNDAVDNAIDRLKTSSKIRAIRINGKRSNYGQDDGDEILSEENCLKFFYKSVSSDIAEESLDKWKHDFDEENELQKDLRDLELKDENITHLNESLQASFAELGRLRGDYDTQKANFEEAERANEAVSLQKDNLEKFLKCVQGEDTDFSLYDEQLKIVEQGAYALNDDDFKLYGGENDLNEFQCNQYVKLFLKNCAELKLMRDGIKAATKNASVTEDLEIAELRRIVSDLQKQQDETDDQSKFDLLGGKINAVKFKIKQLSKKSGNTDFSLNEVQKGLVSDRLQGMFTSDQKGFITVLDAKVNQFESCMVDVCNQLKNQAENLKVADIKSIEGAMASLEGQIRSVQEDCQSATNGLSAERNFIAGLFQKYSIETTAGNDTLKSAIENRLAQVQGRIEASKLERDTFQDMLKGFKDKLDQHAADNRQMKEDSNLYGDDYVKICNVVGISCTTDPRHLNRNDFDVVIIDEVSKATPPELLLPISRAGKVVLVGDHRQLPPMFKNNERSYNEIIQDVQDSDDYSDDEKELLTEENFNRFKNMVTASLFKDMFRKAPNEIKASLTTQFRSHKQIMDLYNCFYSGHLVCGIPESELETRKAHGITIPTCDNNKFVVPANHAYWIDSSKLPNGEPFYENHPGYTTSCCNVLEEFLTIELLKKINQALLGIGYNKGNRVRVGIISFYQAQINNLRKKVRGMKLEALSVSINTVDRFQGQEKGIIIADLVRNKPADANGKVRVSDHVLAYERINVALSRAENLLFVVGAKDFFEKLRVNLPTFDDSDEVDTPVYKQILEKLSRNGCVFPSGSVLKKDVMEGIDKELKAIGCQMNQKNQLSGKKNTSESRR